jgi:hypothetical protein
MMYRFLIIFLVFISCTAQKAETILPIDTVNISSVNTSLRTKLVYLESINKNFKGRNFSEFEHELNKLNIKIENAAYGTKTGNYKEISFIRIDFPKTKRDLKENSNFSIQTIQINFTKNFPPKMSKYTSEKVSIWRSELSSEFSDFKISNVRYLTEIYSYNEEKGYNQVEFYNIKGKKEKLFYK